MSNNYDVLFAVVLRLPSERGTEIFQNIDEILKKVGDSIAKEYEDFGVYPLGMELVEPDHDFKEDLVHLEEAIETVQEKYSDNQDIQKAIREIVELKKELSS